MLAACGGGGSDAGTPVSVPTVPTSSSSVSIRISSPATSSVVTTSSVSMTGTASGNVTEVDWNNATLNTGGRASGTANWSANIPLQIGNNLLVVTAKDSTGKSASVNATITYVQSGQVSVMGHVDSSLVDRNGGNAVYLYTGAVTPDDAGGAGANPYAIVPVRQDDGGCTWSYQLGSLPAGQYTVAFTDQAAGDAPDADDPIVFKGTTTIQIHGGTPVTKNFAAVRVLQVGPGRSYATPSAAAAVAKDGDVIEIDAGEYLNDVTVWRRNNLTLRGVGGTRAYMRATRLIPYTPGNDSENGMGIWVTKARGITVENIEFSGAAVPDQNGAGIRVDGPDITICNSYFHDNENGILGGGGDVLIEYSEFAFNGYGDGQSHNMYIDGTDRFTLQYSYSHHARIGHNVKSRAAENHILYNRIMDEQDGTASYAIDLPDCGMSYLIGNLIQQGPGTDNSTMVSYGAEGCLNPKKELYVVNNTLVNDLGSGIFLYVRSGTTAQIVNNIFAGNGKVLSGSGMMTSNLISNAPGMFDMTNFDYRLTAISPARDAGSIPGTVNGVDLTPRYHYVHRSNREPRPAAGTIDIGAYEYSP